jgi:hypothetical protein
MMDMPQHPADYGVPTGHVPRPDDRKGKCSKPCGTLDCAWGCLYGNNWTGSGVDAPTSCSAVRTEDPPPYAPAPRQAADPLVKAVDDWIEMERKARAWDAMRLKAGLVVGSMMDETLSQVDLSRTEA